MYYSGNGVPQDYQEAVRWYHLAAEQGSADAQFGLGIVRLRSSLARLLAVPAYDAVQRRIGFQRGGDATRLDPQQAAGPNPLQHLGKDCFVDCHIQ